MGLEFCQPYCVCSGEVQFNINEMTAHWERGNSLIYGTKILFRTSNAKIHFKIHFHVEPKIAIQQLLFSVYLD